jgi:hypothetical protein
VRAFESFSAGLQTERAMLQLFDTDDNEGKVIQLIFAFISPIMVGADLAARNPA